MTLMGLFVCASICVFILAVQEAGGMNLFDDAYVDVMEGAHIRMSSQLLTWVSHILWS